MREYSALTIQATTAGQEKELTVPQLNWQYALLAIPYRLSLKVTKFEKA